MGLTSQHDFYSSWHLYICRSLFGHSTFFVASLVFVKGTSCCVIRRNFKWNWAVRSCYGKVLWVIGQHDFRCYLLSLRGVWHLCNHVFMHCFGSFLLQAIFWVYAFVEFIYSKSLANRFYSVKRFPSSHSDDKNMNKLVDWKAFVDTYGIKNVDLRNKFLFRVLRLSELPKCKKKPQIAIRCLEWLGKLNPY